MLEWLVIGGGPQGVHTALRLIGEAGVPRERVRILDPEASLLARWRRSTRNTGMRYLRSPSVHHIDLSSSSLQHFASGRGRCVDRPFTRPYMRPALELFDLHCRDVIERNRLDELHVSGHAVRLDLRGSHARVGFVAEDGGGAEIEARFVVLALGAPLEPEWPAWARRAVSEGKDPSFGASLAPIRHVFDPGFELEERIEDAVVGVIGAGISGAQVALRLARDGRRVVLISRHALRIEQFDSDPGWQGPMHMSGFGRLRDPDERRRRIRAARHRGSMPPEVHSALRLACAEDRIELLEEAEVDSASVMGAGVAIDVGGRSIQADRVLLATGFPARRPGGEWLDEAVDAHGLPSAGCGYPIVDRALRWHPRLLVTGALAELELGPVARNLSGAQRAGDRLVAFARQLVAPRPPTRRTASQGMRAFAASADRATSRRATSGTA